MANGGKNKEKEGGAYCCLFLFFNALRVSRFGCFFQFQVDVGDDERNGGSSQSCAGS